MPQAAEAPIFPPETARLIELVEGNLHYIVKISMTRDQAIELRRRLTMPIGILASRHNLQTFKSRIEEAERKAVDKVLDRH